MRNDYTETREYTLLDVCENAEEKGDQQKAKV